MINLQKQNTYIPSAISLCISLTTSFQAERACQLYDSRALTSRFKIVKTIARKIRYIVYIHNNILIYNIFPLDISCLFAALIEVFDDIHLLSLLIKKYFKKYSQRLLKSTLKIT